MTSAPSNPSDPKFWRAVYALPYQRWEAGQTAPPLQRWFTAHSPAGKTTLVVGCGRGHDARMLARLGARVVAIDFVPEAIIAAQRLAERESLHVDFRERDLFELRQDPDRYALAVEHCCFCAIDPRRRQEYVDVIADVLLPGATLVGLLYTGRSCLDGPPYSVTQREAEEVFGTRFIIESSSVPDDSLIGRQGAELLMLMRRRD